MPEHAKNNWTAESVTGLFEMMPVFPGPHKDDPVKVMPVYLEEYFADVRPACPHCGEIGLGYWLADFEESLYEVKYVAIHMQGDRPRSCGGRLVMVSMKAN